VRYDLGVQLENESVATFCTALSRTPRLRRLVLAGNAIGSAGR
jgi:hypothetical protein